MAKNRYDIAVIPGDGIGKEVVPEGLRALEAAAKRFDIPLYFDHFDFASYDYYAQHGDMMPEDWKHRSAGMMPCSSARSAGRRKFRIMCRSGDRF